MHIKIDDTSFTQSISIFKELRENSSVSDTKVKNYFTTQGIDLLKRHLKIYGGFDFTEKKFLEYIEKIIENPNRLKEDSTIIRSMKRGFKYVDRWEKAFKELELSEIVNQSVELMNKYLPETWKGEVNIYFLCGIRGQSIIYGNEIAVELCDKALEVNEIIDKKEVIKLLAHKLHHIALGEFTKKVYEENKDKTNKILYETICGIMAEGIADCYITDPLVKDGVFKLKWQDNLRKINELFEEVQKTLTKVSYNESSELKDSGHLFDENLIGNTVGYIMIKTIDIVFGKEKVMHCINDYRGFIEFYNQAVKKGGFQLPTMNVKV